MSVYLTMVATCYTQMFVLGSVYFYISTSVGALNPCEHQFMGNIPYPSSCDDYIKCINYHPKKMKCYPSNHFSPKKLKCLPKSIAGCDSKLITKAPPNVKPVTKAQPPVQHVTKAPVPVKSVKKAAAPVNSFTKAPAPVKTITKPPALDKPVTKAPTAMKSGNKAPENVKLVTKASAPVNSAKQAPAAVIPVTEAPAPITTAPASVKPITKSLSTGCVPNKSQVSLFTEHTFRGSKYLISKTLFKTDAISAKQCQSVCGYLTEIDDLDEERFLLKLIDRSGVASFSAGGTDKAKEGAWMYEKGSRPVSFLHWHRAEPKSGKGNEHCICIIKGFGLCDCFCFLTNWKIPFLCEVSSEGDGNNVKNKTCY